jgi:predicted negative regulator of RcsB-dependent stress response
VEIYQTEEQQVEAIKGYWAQNGNTIIAGIVLGFAGFIGFNIYQDKQFEQELTISDEYQSLIEKSGGDVTVFNTEAEQFIADNGNNSYVALTALALAKESAKSNDWEKVQQHLTTAIAKSPTQGITAIASLRLARVQVQIEQYSEALATLNSEFPQSFTAAIEEIKGDIYLQQGKNDLARNAYQAAIAADGLTTNPSLQIKLDDLAQVISLPIKSVLPITTEPVIK